MRFTSKDILFIANKYNLSIFASNKVSYELIEKPLLPIIIYNYNFEHFDP